MTIICVDKDIKLKSFEISEANILFNLTNSNRHYLRQWLPWLDSVKCDLDSRKYIIGTINHSEENKGLQLGIWFKGQLVGVIGYLFLDWNNRIGYIGYWLGEEYEGKGIMTKSCQSLIEFGFKELRLNKVDIRCAEENIKSNLIPQRLGFTKEGRIREAEWLYDHFVNHIVYGILEKELPLNHQ